MNKTVSFFISLVLTLLFGALLFLPLFDTSYKKMPLFNLVDQLDKMVYDTKLRMRGSGEPTGDVVIVGIDDEALSKVGRWPWSRKVLQELTDRILQGGAKLVAYDFVFAEAEENPLARFYYESQKNPQFMSRKGSEDFLSYLGSEFKKKDADRNFADFIEKNHERLVFSYKFSSQKKLWQGLPKNPLHVSHEEEELLKPVFKTYKGLISNIPEYQEVLAYEGFLNAEVDTDSVYRRAHLVHKFGKDIYPSLALQAYALSLGRVSPSLVIENFAQFSGFSPLKVGDEILRSDYRGAITVNYRGSFGSFPYLGAYDVLKGDSAQVSSFLKEKIVLIGTNSELLTDEKATPFDHKRASSVEYQASVLDNLVRGDYFYHSETGAVLEFFFMIFLAICLVFLALKVPYSQSLPVFIALFFAIGLFDYFYLFLHKKIVSDLAYIYLEMIFVYGVLILYRYFVEEKDNRYLINTFKSYLSPVLIDSMYSEKVLPELGGDTRYMTAFFSDIKGFSTLSEKLTPKELVSWLNTYLTEMTNILVDEMGTLDKYEGDAIVAFFGAPVAFENHAFKACYAALSMQIRLEGMRREAQGKKDQMSVLLTQTKARIGINTGRIMTGNVGSEKRMNYTMIGHAVNLASRLESAAKQYGVSIQVTEKTQKEVEGDFVMRPLDKIVVLGVKEPVMTYELLCGKDGSHENLSKLAELFDKGMELYFKKKWQGAKAYFEEALTYEKDRLFSYDKNLNPSKIYIERCEAYLVKDPGADWDGVTYLDKK